MKRSFLFFMAKESEKWRNVGKNGSGQNYKKLILQNSAVMVIGFTCERLTVRKLTLCKRLANFTVTPASTTEKIPFFLVLMDAVRSPTWVIYMLRKTRSNYHRDSRTWTRTLAVMTLTWTWTLTVSVRTRTVRIWTRTGRTRLHHCWSVISPCA